MLDTEREDLCRILEVDHLPESLETLYSRIRRYKDRLHAQSEFTQADKAIVVALWQMQQGEEDEEAEDHLSKTKKVVPPKAKVTSKKTKQTVPPEVQFDDDPL